MCVISCIISAVLSASIAVTIFAAVIASNKKPLTTDKERMEAEKEAETNEF